MVVTYYIINQQTCLSFNSVPKSACSVYICVNHGIKILFSLLCLSFTLLQARSRTFHIALMLLPMPMELWAATKKLHHTHSVAVTPALVRVPTQRLSRELFTLPLCMKLNLSGRKIGKANKGIKKIQERQQEIKENTQENGTGQRPAQEMDK